MTENKTAYQIGRENQIALIDDMFCDIYADAHRYAPDAKRREMLRRDLLSAITALRDWQEVQPVRVTRIMGQE